MKIAIIAYSNVYRLPYINQYASLFDEDMDVDIIFWNRDAKDETSERFNLVPFDCPVSQNIFERLRGYFFFRKFIIRQVKEARYDLLIITPTFIGLLLNSFLYRRYKGKYIFDIRDYSYENLWPVRFVEKRLVRNALANVVSSPGFMDFLPEGEEYIGVHNNRALEKIKVEEIRKRPKDRSPIKIAFIGFVGYHKQQKKIIDLFKNDERFLLSFIGLNSDALREYCEEREITNVEIRGAFEPSEILDIYKDVDIVNGIYGPNEPAFVYALSNKLYLAADLNMPMIVNVGTFTERYTRDFGFVLGFDMNDPSSPDRLFERYRAIDWDSLDDGCRRFREMVEADNRKFRDVIGSLLRGSK